MKTWCKYIFLITAILSLCSTVKAQNKYSLKRALKKAQENNPDLKTTKYNVAIKKSDTITAKLRPNPTLTNESIQIVQTSEFLPNTPWYNRGNRETFWQISKPFQIAGQRKNKINFSRKKSKVAENLFSEETHSLYLEVAEKWVDVWAAEKNLEVLETAQNNIDSLIISSRIRFENQAITETDFRRTKLLKRQYSIRYKNAKQSLVNKQKKLGFLLGTKERVDIEKSDSIPSYISQSLDSLLALSLQHRRDIQTAQIKVEASKINMSLQKSLAYPQPELGLVWNPQGTVPFLGVSLSIGLPIFDRNQGERQKAHLKKKQAEQYLATLQNQAKLQVDTAYENYKLKKQNLESFIPIIEESRTILKSIKNAYLKGGTTIIDFLEAQRNWFGVQQQYHRALNEYHHSYIQLLYDIGLIQQLAQ